MGDKYKRTKRRARTEGNQTGKDLREKKDKQLKIIKCGRIQMVWSLQLTVNIRHGTLVVTGISRFGSVPTRQPKLKGKGVKLFCLRRERFTFQPLHLATC
jgi:hypothetical protein